MATYKGLTYGHASAASTSIAATTSISVAVGDLIQLMVRWEGGDTTCSVADGLGNTFTRKVKLNHTGGEPAIDVYECFVTSAGTSTPTATFGASVSFRAILGHVFSPDSGKSFSSDASALASAEGNSGAPASGSFSATGAGVASGFFSLYNVLGADTPGSGWTEVADDEPTYGVLYSEYRFVSGAGSLNADFAWVSIDRWVAVGFNTLEVAGGGSAGNIAWIRA